MKQFMVERDLEVVSDEQMQEAVAQSSSSMQEHFPELEWKYSHVCHVDEGIKAFCVYNAPSAERLSKHVEGLGGQVSYQIYEIIGDLNPS